MLSKTKATWVSLTILDAVKTEGCKKGDEAGYGLQGLGCERSLVGSESPRSASSNRGWLEAAVPPGPGAGPRRRSMMVRWTRLTVQLGRGPGSWPG